MSPARVRCRRLLPFVVAACAGVGWASAARADSRVVTVPYTVVRSAPFDVAPELARLQAGDRINADDQPQGEWRRIVLPGGRYGFVRDGDTQHAEGPPAVPVVEPSEDAAGGQPAAPPPAAVRYTESFGPPTTPLLGVAFDMFPVGTLSTSANSSDTVFAVGVSAFVDYSLSPWLAFGVSPQVIFRVKPDGLVDESAKELDLRGRLTARLPLSPKVRVFGRLSPGYSVIVLPSFPGLDRPNPAGLVMDVSVGAEVAVLPRLFIVSGLGYQMGFQSTSVGDFRTRYLHLGAGFAIGL
jgi:DNA gyrase inhibitor GyrI